MRLFLSWSEKKSGDVAARFATFIRCAIQSIEPWISSRDIDNGTVWFGEISSQLSSCSSGVIFITKNNQNNPWLLFESGALYKGLSENRIFTYLVDMPVSDIELGSPFTQINHTTHNRESVLKLIESINKTLGDDLKSVDVIREIFDALWVKYDEDIKTILNSEVDTNDKEKNSEENILNNILENVLIINRRISMIKNRTQGGSVGRYIEPSHAINVLRELTQLTDDKNKILKICSNFAPEDFIKRRMSSISDEIFTEINDE